MRTIVWDWNGTLLNDVPIAHRVFAEIVAEQNITAPTISEWRALYRHPIQAMYEEVGFDFTKESFASLATRWYARYKEASGYASLFSEALGVLDSFQQRGFTQLVISALEEDLLFEQVRARGVWGHMKHVSGHHDLTADSKVSRAQQVMQRHIFSDNPVMVIGDTSHDAEMAKAIGAECILVAHGYEDAQRLGVHGFTVVDGLECILDII